jgi:uncharacterized protein YdeI (YjbR/CyaY-like superfamily)
VSNEKSSADKIAIREMNLLNRECQTIAARIEKLENAEAGGWDGCSKEEVAAQLDELSALVDQHAEKNRRLDALRAIVYPNTGRFGAK